jgi:amino acid adenylation domain-containing protein
MVDKKSIEQFLVDSSARGIHFLVEQGVLKSRAPEGAIGDEVSRFVRANKAEIIACLEGGFVIPSLVSSQRLAPRSAAGEGGALSLAQERFWFIDQLNGESPLYNMPIALRIAGRFDADVAEQALQRIVDRHAPLRCVYRTAEDGSGLQQPRASSEFRLLRIDLSQWSEKDQQERVEAVMRESAGRSFDLSKDLMLRGTYITLSPSQGILLLCVHHIAADGWSFRVMELEFVEQYHAVRDNRPDPLPALRITYADYIDWQRARLADGSTAAELKYWQDQLADLPPVHTLPLDHPRSESADQLGGQFGFQLDPEVHAGLKRLALSTHTTLFMILHAGFSLLLSRYSGASDIVLGTPVLNRLEKELELLVGCFVNSLVLRVDCRPDMTLADFLNQVKSVNLDAQMHQEITFEQIVDHMNPTRSAQYSPLFQIMFSMGMPQETAHRKMPDLALSQLEHIGTTAKFDLSLYAQESFGDLFFGVEYRSSLFERETIERMAGHYQNLLASIVNDPSATLSDLPMHDPGEVRTLIEDFSRGPEIAIEGTCIHTLFEQQASNSPDAIAIVHDGAQRTYSELNARANRLAHHLRSLGIGPDQRIALVLDRSLDLAAAILAVWKSGAAYVPVDPSYPQARVQAMFEDADVRWVVSQASSTNQLPDIPFNLISIDSAELKDAMSAMPGENPDNALVQLTPRHLAYVIFTSGSSGRPKGVMVEHRNLLNLRVALAPILARAGVPSPCRWAWNASPAFDASLQALLQLSEGSTLHLLSDPVRQDPELMRAYLEQQNIDVFDATPLQMDLLLDCAGESGFLPSAIIGGEAIARPLWQRISRHYAGRPQSAFNVYGPTEATVDASAAEIVGERPNIGRPLANTNCHVLDRRGDLQPIGVPGELYLSGAGVARGYAGSDSLNVDRFVDTMIGGSQQRAYRSGDIVRWLSDGSLEFFGRGDTQVKIRGYRIELAEIEHQLGKLESVASAVVLSRPGPDASLELVGYVVPAIDILLASSDEWTGELRRTLRMALPDYMIPAHIIAIEAMPLTANGKLDRNALPEPDARSASMRERRPPERAIEQVIAGIWEERLRVASISVDDNFFELGGNSILAARVISRVAAVFQVRIPLRLFFENPSVEGVARILGDLEDASMLDEVAEVYLSIANLDEGEVSALLAAEEEA